MVDSGHTFGKKTFHKPTYCHHCSDLLWGLIGQGYICEGILVYILYVLFLTKKKILHLTLTSCDAQMALHFIHLFGFVVIVSLIGRQYPNQLTLYTNILLA